MSEQGDALVSKAMSGLGKNGSAYGLSKNWCNRFVWKCADAAGIPASVIPHNDLVDTTYLFYKGQGRFYAKGSYTPQKGDLVFYKFKSGASRKYANHIGIVYQTSSSRLYSIAGNTSRGVVGYQNYALSYSEIIGFATPAYQTNVESRTSSANAASKDKPITKTVITEIKPEDGDVYVAKEDFANLDTNYVATGTIKVLLGKRDSRTAVELPCEGEITWETTRRYSPGRVVFNYVSTLVNQSDPYTEKPNIQEGDPVMIMSDDKGIFYGYVFSKSRTSNGIIEVTAYDQLRYFTNVDTYKYKDKTASELLKMICKDYDFKYGVIENTKAAITSTEDSKSLWNIMRNAIEETTVRADELYVMYDNFGELTLKSTANMKLNYLLRDVTVQDYNYTSSIEETSNVIEVAYDNHASGIREVTLVKDDNNIKRWGRLQLFDTRDSNLFLDTVALALYKQNNRKKRTLSVSDAFGDLRVRAGCRIVVELNLGDIVVNHMMLVQSVTHKFSESAHWMDMELVGGEFDTDE